MAFLSCSERSKDWKGQIVTKIPEEDHAVLTTALGLVYDKMFEQMLKDGRRMTGMVDMQQYDSVKEGWNIVEAFGMDKDTNGKVE